MASSKSFVPDNVITASDMNNLDVMMSRFVLAIKNGIDVCIPAVVTKYDRGTKMATVVPLVKYKFFKDGKEVYNANEEFQVSVRQVCFGGFSLDIPLYTGDTGWVVSSDVDTSVLKQNGNEVCKVTEGDLGSVANVQQMLQIPGSSLVHCFGHGFFIPDCWGAFTPESIVTGESEVGRNAMYIGESAPDTCSVDENGVSSVKDKKDDLASISITRKEGERKGKVQISVGKKCSVSVDGESKKIKLAVGECHITINEKTISISGPDQVSISTRHLSLPANTTVGGKHFSENAFS